MGEVIQLISTYGLALVISGLVIYFAIQFGNIALEEARRKRDAKRHDGLAAMRNQVSTTINALIERTLLRARACRVYVFEFHNGTQTMGGLPFLKMTNTYEALGEGAKSEAHRRENMSLQLYSSFIDALCANDYLVMDVNDRTGDYSQLVYETLVERGIAVTVRAKIMDINKKVIGYLGIDFCNEEPDSATVRDSVGIVQDVAVELGALLSVNK